MKKALLLTALLIVVAVPAMANGVNIGWNTDCYTATGVTNVSFLCNRNTLSNTMWMSFLPTNNQPEFVGIEAYLTGMVDAVAVPDWWNISTNVAGCRTGAASASAGFTDAPGGCTDPWAGLGMGGLAAYVVSGNTMNVVIGFALAAASPLTAGVEYYGCKMTITNVKTVGTGACTGCLIPAIWGLKKFKSAELTQYEWHTEPIEGGNQCVTWQGGGTLECAPPVPVKNSTWGQVKGLYR